MASGKLTRAGKRPQAQRSPGQGTRRGSPPWRAYGLPPITDRLYGTRYIPVAIIFGLTGGLVGKRRFSVSAQHKVHGGTYVRAALTPQGAQKTDPGTLPAAPRVSHRSTPFARSHNTAYSARNRSIKRSSRIRISTKIIDLAGEAEASRHLPLWIET